MARPDQTVASDVPPPLHELSGRVMEAVWDGGEVTGREVLAALNAREEKQLAYTTVMTIMNRLRRRGLLSRERRDRTDVYRAVHERDVYVQLRARAEVEALVEQFGDSALVHFVAQVESLDSERREALRRLAGRD